MLDSASGDENSEIGQSGGCYRVSVGGAPWDGQIDLGIDGLESATEVGHGGNAVVYRARQTELDRNVAVKVLNDRDEDTQRRFDRERRAMGRLSEHDGIVTVYETGYTTSGHPYLVMPLLSRSLDQELVDRFRFPVREAAALMVDVCRTVEHAHRQGVVHRDLKPGNLMRALSGRVLVADFGISRITNTSTSLKSTALTLTPAFSPPEALEQGEALTASDIYSLGATLYALLSGHPPFVEPGEQTPLLVLMRRIVEEPFAALTDVPAPVNDVLATALAKDPAQRFASAGEMAEALDAIVRGPDHVAERSIDTVVASEREHDTRTTAIGSPRPDLVQTIADPPRPPHVADAAATRSRWRGVGWLAAFALAAIVIAGIVVAVVRSPDDTDASPGGAETGATGDSVVDVAVGETVDVEGAPDSAPDAEISAVDITDVALAPESEVRFDGFRLERIEGRYAIGTTSSGGSAVTLVIIDRVEQQEVARTELQSGAFSSDAVELANGQIWVGLANQSSIVVFEPACRCVDRVFPVRTDRVSALHEVGGLVWIDDFDPVGQQVVFAGLDLDGIVVSEVVPPPRSSTRLAERRLGDLLVATSDEGLSLVDPIDRDVVGPFATGTATSAVVESGSRILWTNGQTGTLQSSNEVGTVTSVVVSSSATDGVPTVSGLLVDPSGGLVWLADGPAGSVVAHDPDGLGEVHRVDVAGVAATSSPKAALGLIWVAAAERVVAIDPATARVVGEIPVPGVQVPAFDVDDDQFWITGFEDDGVTPYAIARRIEVN